MGFRPAVLAGQIAGLMLGYYDMPEETEKILKDSSLFLFFISFLLSLPSRRQLRYLHHP